MSTKENFKRYILFVISLFFAAMGVAVTKRGDLGVSPVSSVANVMSSKFDFLSMGVCLIIWNCLLIVGQIIILRRDLKLFQLLQIPLSLLFGIFPVPLVLPKKFFFLSLFSPLSSTIVDTEPM